MSLIDRMKRRHFRLEHELAVEQARRMPDRIRVSQLKKLKLAIKDRMTRIAAQGRQGLPQPG